MKRQRTLGRILVGLACVTSMLCAQQAEGTGSAAGTQANAQIEQLKAEIAAQQKQLESMQAALEQQKKMLENLIRPKPASLGEVASTTPMIPKGPETASASPVPMASPSPRPSPNSMAQPPAAEENPLQLRIGGATITPVGFMDFTNTFRSTASGANLATNFGSIPYNNTVGGRLTEDHQSLQNSRIGFRVDALFHDWHVLGYYEGDFVGGVGYRADNTQVSSNSMLYRLRLYWVDLRKNQFEMLAGQSWSMMTPNRKQISALPGDLFYGQEFDVNYLAGLTWGRIPGIRFLYHPTEKITAGISLENSTQYFGGSGGGGTPSLPAALGSLATTQLDANQNNGLGIPNLHPDIIAKLAFDPTARVHFEFAGVESSFRLFNPNTQQYFTKAGGGGSVNGNFEVVKNFRLITNNYWSDGGGRYMFGQAPDFIVRADGSPSLIHSGSTLDGFEATFKNSLLYAYYGGVYVGRNTARDLNGSMIGYGYAGSPNSQNRTIQEGTIGLTQTFWKDPRYGAVSMFIQYAYFFRNPWFVAPGAPKNAHENTIFFDLRYTLPGLAPAIKY
jgi:hypothetical protein